MKEEERQENLFDDENPDPKRKQAKKNLAVFQGKDKEKAQPANAEAEKAPVN